MAVLKSVIRDRADLVELASMDVIGHHFDKMTLLEYAKADIEWLEYAYAFKPSPPKVKPPKSHAGGRTMSWKKYAGSRSNRPKYFWGKKKRARMGWKV